MREKKRLETKAKKCQSNKIKAMATTLKYRRNVAWSRLDEILRYQQRKSTRHTTNDGDGSGRDGSNNKTKTKKMKQRTNGGKSNGGTRNTKSLSWPSL